MVVEEEDDDAYLERAKNKWQGRLYFPNSKKMGKEREVPLLPHPTPSNTTTSHPAPSRPTPSAPPHSTPPHPTPPHPTPGPLEGSVVRRGEEGLACARAS